MKNYQIYLHGYVGGWDFDKEYVAYVLEQNKDKEVNVLIDSLGGDLSTALSISSLFKMHGNVTVHYVGMNASAATVASLGAKHISIDSNAMYLVHQCSSEVCMWEDMNASDLDSFISRLSTIKDDLSKIDANIAEAYAKKCKKSVEDLFNLMKIGGWLNAKEALEWGFVDELTELEEDDAPVINDSIIKAMKSKGMPVPSIKNEDSLVNRIINAMTSVFDKKKTKILKMMKKIFKNICKVLEVESLDEEDGNITMTTEQVQKIEDELENLTEQVLTLTTKIEETENKLDYKPAATTKQVMNQAGNKANQFDSYVSKVTSARKLFNKI